MKITVISRMFNLFTIERNVIKHINRGKNKTLKKNKFDLETQKLANIYARFNKPR